MPKLQVSSQSACGPYGLGSSSWRAFSHALLCFCGCCCCVNLWRPTYQVSEHRPARSIERPGCHNGDEPRADISTPSVTRSNP